MKKLLITAVFLGVLALGVDPALAGVGISEVVPLDLGPVHS
ncbi:hypothetical protein [Halalkalibacter okhensis]|nr:hypothetical protein [Halalkalibacter okhensis]